MQPKFTTLPRLTLLGLSFYGDPFSSGDAWSEENQIGRLWQRFMRAFAELEVRLSALPVANVTYEVHIYNPETLEKGLFEVFVGVEVDDLQAAPVELLVKALPAGEYAVFTFQGEEIISDWDQHIDEWLAQAGTIRRHSYSFQRYDERFKGLGECLAESTLDVYLPVQKAA